MFIPKVLLIVMASRWVLIFLKRENSDFNTINNESNTVPSSVLNYSKTKQGFGEF